MRLKGWHYALGRVSVLFFLILVMPLPKDLTHCFPPNLTSHNYTQAQNAVGILCCRVKYSYTLKRLFKHNHDCLIASLKDWT